MSETTTVTSIKLQKGRKDRVSIFLNDKYSFGLSLDVAHEFNIYTGQKLTPQEVSIINEFELFHKAVNTALRYISYRPRSESEIRTRLRRQKYDSGLIVKVIDKLKQQRVVDDAIFAEFWKDIREFFSPRSKRLIKLELRRKGVTDEIAERTTNDVDDQTGAYKAALKKAYSLKSLEFDIFQKKLLNFLHNRGFGYQIIRPTIDKVWAELEQEKTAE
ncbi:regulatory protein RecX [Chloroflexota bacterium]